MAYEELFRKVGQANGIDWRLLAEVAWRESRYDPRAVGRAGDMGLMQIMPSTWNEWAPKVGVTDPFDPESNIRVATALLVWLRDLLGKNGRPETYWSLVAYNWGIGNVLRLLQAGGSWSQVPPERQNYALDIALATEVRRLSEEGGPADGT
jgi:membrane-bound lytic murein transglycosylase F